jgi:hypothetical protein
VAISRSMLLAYSEQEILAKLKHFSLLCSFVSGKEKVFLNFDSGVKVLK